MAGVHATAFAAELKVSGGQAKQTRSDDTVSAAAMYVPARQADTGAHEAELDLLEYSSLSRLHGLQVRSVVRVGALITYVPAGQLLTAVHSSALDCCEKPRPLVQGWHSRSEDAVPSWTMYWPGRHQVNATHAVADAGDA